MKTIEFQKKLNQIHNDEYILLSEYVNTHTKVLILHKVCGEKSWVNPCNIIKGTRCPKYSWRKVLQYDLEGNFIREYKNLKEVECITGYKKDPFIDVVLKNTELLTDIYGNLMIHFLINSLYI